MVIGSVINEEVKMQIIDNKGFVHLLKWKINIIDLMVVIFLLSMIPMFWFCYKIVTKKPPPPPPPLITWEQKYNEEIIKFNEEIAKQEEIFKKHPRMRKYFE